jgi:peptide chain release factor subunit 3
MEPDERQHVHLVFIGHVDAGKSTTAGNILIKSGEVDQRTVEKYMRDAEALGRESWYQAYALDTSEEERERGKTVEVGRAPFSTKVRRYTILDCPGHQSYVPNMISGASQADIAILVISARAGEFEAGFNRGGQTREHVLLCKTLGVEQLVVAVNKMDEPSVEWAEDRYNTIIAQLTPFLTKSGFSVENVHWCPISGFTGENVLTPPHDDRASWVETPTLLQICDTLDIGFRDPAKPLRIPLLEGYKDMGITCATGKIEQGTLVNGQKIIIMPSQLEATVTGITSNANELQVAYPGEGVVIKLKGVEDTDITKGSIMCCPKNPVMACKKFRAKIQIKDKVDHIPFISPGYECNFHIHTDCVECQVTKVTEVLKKGKKVNAVYATVDTVASVTIEASHPVCMDTFSGHAQLGRFTLRCEDKTVAIGRITQVAPLKPGELTRDHE